MKAIADMKPIEEGELLYDDEPMIENEPEVATYTAPQPEMQKIVAEKDENINVLTKQIEKERMAREEMFEQTQQLKLQVSEYENELNDVSNNMSRTNRILNVILTLLIIALFVILFVMGFFFAKERGLI
jgi:chromosome segregation ATPase